jgi:hypothetical protein
MAYYLIGQVGQPKFLHIETRIIKPKFSNVIFDTISNKCYTGRTNFIMNPPYKFKLIYRGSRDGINCSTFRDRCMLGRVASFVIIKIQESSEIYVVYRSCGFNSVDYLINLYDCNNNDDFILSFKNRENTSRNMNNCDSLCIINEKLHVKHYNGYRWSTRDEKKWTTNIYTIEEIEAFVKFDENYLR